MIRRPLQRLVRPGRPRPHPAARPPAPAQPHLDPSCRFAAARADRTSPAVGAAGRRRVTAASGPRQPSRLRRRGGRRYRRGRTTQLSGGGNHLRSRRTSLMTRRPLQRLVRPGDPGRTPPRNRRPRPNPTSALRAPSRPLAPTRFGGRRGRVPEARDRERRGRAAEPPTHAGGLRCRSRPNDPAQRRRKPPTGPHNRLMIRRPLHAWFGRGDLGHIPPSDGLSRPAPPRRFVCLRGRPRPQGFAGRRGRGPESRGSKPRGRAAGPPARGGGRGALKAERPSSPAAEITTRVVKPADDWRSGAAPGSAGAPRATPMPRDGLRKPNPTSTPRAPSRPPARTSFASLSGPRAGGA